MKLSNLVLNIYERQSELSREQIERSVQLICGTMADTLARNGRVEIRGFGIFFLSQRKPRALRNPRSGKRIFVAARAVPRFKAGKQLRLKVDSQGTDPA